MSTAPSRPSVLLERLVSTETVADDELLRLEEQSLANSTTDVRVLQEAIGQWLQRHMKIPIGQDDEFLPSFQSGVVLGQLLKQSVDSVQLVVQQDATIGSMKARENIEQFLHVYQTLASVPPLAFSPDDLIQGRDPMYVCFGGNLQSVLNSHPVPVLLLIV